MPQIRSFSRNLLDLCLIYFPNYSVMRVIRLFLLINFISFPNIAKSEDLTSGSIKNLPMVRSLIGIVEIDFSKGFNQSHILDGATMNSITFHDRIKTYSLPASLLILSVSLFVLNIYLKAKRKDKKSIPNSSNYKNDIDRLLLENKKLLSDIEYKTKELTSFTLSLVQKNEIIIRLQQNIEELSKTAETAELKSKLRMLSKSIDLSNQVEQEWINFRKHFDQVHPDFFIKLKLAYPTLTQSDIKLSTLLKLNLETKQIATILGISTDSVKVLRHRLKKKMGIPSNQSIDEYLESLDQVIATGTIPTDRTINTE